MSDRTSIPGYGPVWAALIVGLAATALLVWFAVSHAVSMQRQSFGDAVDLAAQSVAGDIGGLEHAMEAANAYLGATGAIDRGDFENFATTLMARFPAIDLMVYAPRVAPEDRADFEARLRRLGFAGFTVRVPGDGAPAPAPTDGATRFPVLLIEPYVPVAAPSLGLDLGAVEGFADRLGDAVGGLVIEAPPLSGGDAPSLWIINAQGGDDGVAARGIVGLRFDPAAAVAIEVDRAMDVTLDLPERALALADDRAPDAPVLTRLTDERALRLGRSRLTLRFAHALTLSDLATWYVAVTGLLGLALTGTLILAARTARQRQLLLIELAAHRDRLEDLVAERTDELNRYSRLLEVVDRLRARFIHEPDPFVVFDKLLGDVLELTDSEYGFIGAILEDEDGKPYLKSYAISNIAWNDETRAFYEKNKKSGFEFKNLATLFGRVITENEPVIANDPAHHPGAAGTPPGHPPLRAFLGIPLHHGDKLVGEIGLANRPGGYDEALLKYLEPMLAACAQVIVARQDAEARRQAEDSLAHTAEALRRSNRELQQFAYVVSHDLQEPLRMVTSYVQLLARRYQGEIDAEADEFIHFAVDGATRMSQMIQSLLDYARVETRGGSLEAVTPATILGEAIENLQAAIDEAEAEISIGDLPPVIADRDQLLRLFQNLVGNAVKYHKPGRRPRIAVEGEVQGDMVHLTVADDGIGLPEDERENIFAVFHRVHDRDIYPGTGIGLAICKRIVDRHGGRIWVDGVEGEGATFHVLLKSADGGG